MINLLKAIAAFLWYRNSVRAEVLVIELCDYLYPYNLKNMANYMKSLADSLERNTTKYRKKE